jgi:hypothetical protein
MNPFLVFRMTIIRICLYIYIYFNKKKREKKKRNAKRTKNVWPTKKKKLSRGKNLRKII